MRLGGVVGGCRDSQNPLVSTGPGVGMEAGSLCTWQSSEVTVRQVVVPDGQLSHGQAGQWPVSQTYMLLRHPGRVLAVPILESPVQSLLLLAYLLQNTGGRGCSPGPCCPQLFKPGPLGLLLLLSPCEHS